MAIEDAVVLAELIGQNIPGETVLDAVHGAAL